MKIHSNLVRSILLGLGILALLVPAQVHPDPARAQSTAPAAIDAPFTPTGEAKISPRLQAELAAATGPVSFLAILHAQPDPAALTAIAQVAGATVTQAAAGDNPAERARQAQIAQRAALYAHLTAAATRSQADLRAWLDAQGIAYRPYYLVNMLEIRGDSTLIEQLATRPEIAQLAANPPLAASQNLGFAEAIPDPPPSPRASEIRQTLPPETGINYVRAPSVWELGHRGAGVVIAGGDTGVDWDHPSLLTKYRGWDADTATANHDYSWLDAWREDDQNSQNPTACAYVTVPCDDWGHGTHTMGTMVAAPNPQDDRLIGMAPDAKWIACRNMRNNFGTPAKYTDCFQFFLAPYPQGGDPFTDGNPALGADVINNSWGCPPSEGCNPTSLRDVIETVRAAGIFIVASAGNSGPRCGTVDAPPALHDAAFTVGAHDLAGTIAGFSSRGPVTIDGSNRSKPELVAPGVSVYSTHLEGSYLSISGTSMAAPHVAGAVALIWSAVPGLRGNVAMTEEILVKSATPVLNNNCDEGQPAQAPNNTYGYGRLDAYRAVLIALSPWKVGVRVLDAGGTPLANIPVDLEDELTGLQITVETGADGWARWPTIYPGTYSCQIGLTAPELGGTSISLLPATDFPEQASEERGLTVGSCRTLAPPAPAGFLYVPTAARD